jgi:plasmid stabilization system protein ParE
VKLLWTQTAIDRVAEIHRYIKKDNPINAQRWVESLLDKISRLTGAPRMGRKVPEIGSENLRELIFGNYRIIYKTAGDVIYLMTVRNFKQMLPVDEIISGEK